MVKVQKFCLKNLRIQLKKLNLLSKEYEVIYCFSRRTPINIKNMIKQKASKKKSFFPTKKNNPYWFY